MTMIAVQTEGLAKRYGAVHALCGVSLSVPRGTVLGLLGPNGAGKTTAVRILTTLLRPDAGRAWVAGYDVVTQPRAVRALIGLAGQYAAVDESLTGRENLELVGQLYHLPSARVRARAAELLDRFDLRDAAGRQVKTYSGGMRRRLDLCASLVAEPVVLFLDEPTTGLDPRSRQGLWDVITSLRDQGTTVVLTTQYLEEADRLADRIAVIDGGAVIAEGTAAELKARVGGDVLELAIADRSRIADAAATLGPVAAGEPALDRVSGRLRLPLGTNGVDVTDVVRRLDAAGVRVTDIATHRPTLDDVFFALTGHTAQSDGSDLDSMRHAAIEDRSVA